MAPFGQWEWCVRAVLAFPNNPMSYVVTVHCLLVRNMGGSTQIIQEDVFHPDIWSADHQIVVPL